MSGRQAGAWEGGWYGTCACTHTTFVDAQQHLYAVLSEIQVADHLQ